MTDFRENLYDHYVSGFNTEVTTDRQLNSLLHWYLYKYAPFFAALPKDAHILELGCGQGNMLAFLSQLGFSNTEGIDISAEQVAIATARGFKVRVADVFEFLESQPSLCDVIIALDFFEHFTKVELLRLLSAIRATLKPGGMLILQTPNGQGLFPHQIIYGDLTHMTILNPSSLRQLLQTTGFTDIKIIESGPAGPELKNRLREIGWQAIKAGANLIRRIETGKTQDIWTENMICCCHAATKATTS